MNKITFPIANRARWYRKFSSKHCPYARAIRVWRASKRHNKKINSVPSLDQILKKRGALIKLS